MPPTIPIASRSVVISVMRFRLPTTRSGLTWKRIPISGTRGAEMSAPLSRLTRRPSGLKRLPTSAFWHAKDRRFASGNTAHPPAGSFPFFPTSHQMTVSLGSHTTGILKISAGCSATWARSACSTGRNSLTRMMFCWRIGRMSMTVSTTYLKICAHIF